MNSIYSKLIFLGLVIINTQIATAAHPGDQSGETFTMDAPTSQQLINDDGEDYYEKPYYAMNRMVLDNCKEQNLTNYSEYKIAQDKNFVECTKKISNDFTYLFNGYKPKDSRYVRSPQYQTMLTILETIKNRFKSITGYDLTELSDFK